jgi:hypothetical protein
VVAWAADLNTENTEKQRKEERKRQERSEGCSSQVDLKISAAWGCRSQHRERGETEKNKTES